MHLSIFDEFVLFAMFEVPRTDSESPFEFIPSFSFDPTADRLLSTHEHPHN